MVIIFVSSGGMNYAVLCVWLSGGTGLVAIFIFVFSFCMKCCISVVKNKLSLSCWFNHVATHHHCSITKFLILFKGVVHLYNDSL